MKQKASEQYSGYWQQWIVEAIAVLINIILLFLHLLWATLCWAR